MGYKITPIMGDKIVPTLNLLKLSKKKIIDKLKGFQIKTAVLICVIYDVLQSLY